MTMEVGRVEELISPRNNHKGQSSWGNDKNGLPYQKVISNGNSPFFLSSDPEKSYFIEMLEISK